MEEGPGAREYRQLLEAGKGKEEILLQCPGRNEPYSRLMHLPAPLIEVA